MSVQNEEELRNVWAVGWEACPGLLTGWGGGAQRGRGCCWEWVFGGVAGERELETGSIWALLMEKM